LERDAVPESWIPPEHLLELRCRVRLRQTLADERRAWLQRVHAQLRPRRRRAREACWARMAGGTELSPAGRAVVATAERMCEAINCEIAGLDQQLAVWARRHPACRALQRLFLTLVRSSRSRCMPRSVTRAGSAPPANRSLAGLDMTVSESADKRSPGRLSRQGAPNLRWAAYEAALSACHHGSPDHADFRPLTRH
jgi:hypothetical protein